MMKFIEDMPLSDMRTFMDRAAHDLKAAESEMNPAVASILEDLIMVVDGLLQRQRTTEWDRA